MLYHYRMHLLPKDDVDLDVLPQQAVNPVGFISPCVGDVSLGFRDTGQYLYTVPIFLMKRSKKIFSTSITFPPGLLINAAFSQIYSHEVNDCSRLVINITGSFSRPIRDILRFKSANIGSVKLLSIYQTVCLIHKHPFKKVTHISCISIAMSISCNPAGAILPYLHSYIMV